jgi:light-regulated signal transduction histidine kinase (bacteriophytochrome)
VGTGPTDGCLCKRLAEIVKEAAKVTIPSTITFTSDINFKLKCDKARMFQLFKNIFENMVRHSKPTEISVKTKVNQHDITLLIRDNSTTADIQWMRETLLTEIGKQIKLNKGIGLAIISRIIHTHGWKLDISADPHLTYRISIPKTAVYFEKSSFPYLDAWLEKT